MVRIVTRQEAWRPFWGTMTNCTALWTKSSAWTVSSPHRTGRACHF